MGSNLLPEPRAVDALRDLLARSAGRECSALETELNSIPAQVAELGRRLVALDRRLPVASQRLQELRRPLDLEAFALAEMRRLQSVPGVTSISVDGSILIVCTEAVVIVWHEVSRLLGRYRLLLDLNGEVRIESVDRRDQRSGWDHPHIQGGLPCLGNLREGVLKLLAEYELALLAQVLLDFLHSYQPETAYTALEGWPVA